jgi:hypothetical protein
MLLRGDVADLSPFSFDQPKTEETAKTCTVAHLSNAA